MAFITDTTMGTKGPSVLQKTATAVMRYLAEASEGNQRLKTVHELQSKSDRELADIGIARNDIVSHVFRYKTGM